MLQSGINPLDNLKINDLRKELSKRGVPVKGKLKPELTQIFDELRQGINDVPALLQPSPQSALSSLHLENYEISPIEPLHDIKGHFGNLLDEIMKAVDGLNLEKLQEIQRTVLGKDSVRCADYRKAVILMYVALRDNNGPWKVTELLRTMVEISEILYENPIARTQQTVLRLHNITFIHSILCRELFDTPKTMSRTKLFGRYFHAITYHAPLMCTATFHQAH